MPAFGFEAYSADGNVWSSSRDIGTLRKIFQGSGSYLAYTLGTVDYWDAGGKQYNYYTRRYEDADRDPNGTFNFTWLRAGYVHPVPPAPVVFDVPEINSTRDDLLVIASAETKVEILNGQIRLHGLRYISDKRVEHFDPQFDPDVSQWCSVKGLDPRNVGGFAHPGWDYRRSVSCTVYALI